MSVVSGSVYDIVDRSTCPLNRVRPPAWLVSAVGVYGTVGRAI